MRAKTIYLKNNVHEFCMKKKVNNSFDGKNVAYRQQLKKNILPSNKRFIKTEKKQYLIKNYNRKVPIFFLI